VRAHAHEQVGAHAGDRPRQIVRAPSLLGRGERSIARTREGVLQRGRRDRREDAEHRGPDRHRHRVQEISGSRCERRIAVMVAE
jgi:hypothetical protein